MVHSQNAIDVTHTLWILGLPADDTINSTIRLLIGEAFYRVGRRPALAASLRHMNGPPPWLGADCSRQGHEQGHGRGTSRYRGHVSFNSCAARPNPRTRHIQRILATQPGAAETAVPEHVVMASSTPHFQWHRGGAGARS